MVEELSADILIVGGGLGGAAGALAADCLFQALAARRIDQTRLRSRARPSSARSSSSVVTAAHCRKI